MWRDALKIRTFVGLLLLTVAGLLIHGYHPYAEDAEIYLPGVQKLLNPSLFPRNADFFGEHAGHTLYPHLIASSVRITHLPLTWAAFLWQLASIFLLLAGAWRLATALFEDSKARWAGVMLMAVLLTLPVAGTALYILDQYLNPRNLAAFAGMFAVAEVLRRRYPAAVLWLVFAAAVHPLMAFFAIGFCALLVVLEKFDVRTFGFTALLPFGLTLDPPPPAYHEVALRQPYFYILRWEWYEWLGVIGPIALFWWLGRVGKNRGMKNVDLVSRAMVPFILLGLAGALVLGIPARFEALARLEPLRCLALSYMVLIVVGGGFLGQFILQEKIWRWLVLFVPLGLGMFAVQRQVFPATTHIEWPWAQPRNSWAQAFDWIRGNTPTDALFALNPKHMDLPGEDEMGFRARAERSMLADAVKDKGAASMFPPLSVKWWEQVQEQMNWKEFKKEDFERLRRKYGVDWIVDEQLSRPGLECPYQNAAVRVCRLN